MPMWTYCSLQEGTLGVDPNFLKTDAGDQPPVIHVDSDASLHSTSDGRLITSKFRRSHIAKNASKGWSLSLNRNHLEDLAHSHPTVFQSLASSVKTSHSLLIRITVTR